MNVNKRVKISVYGENSVVQRTLSPFYSSEIQLDEMKYVGGYHPVNFSIKIETEEILSQFQFIDYDRHPDFVPDLLIDLSQGFLFIVDGPQTEQLKRVEKITSYILEKRKKDMFVSYIGLIQNQMTEGTLTSFVEKLKAIAEILHPHDNFIVSFSLAPDIGKITRTVKDLVQTSKILTFLS